MADSKKEQKKIFGIPYKELEVLELTAPAVERVSIRGKDGKLSIQPVEKLEKILGHKWESVMYYQESTLKKLASVPTQQLSAESLLGLQEKHLEAINGSFIGHMGEFGWGVFAKNDLPKRTIFLTNGLIRLRPEIRKSLKEEIMPSVPDILVGYGSGLLDSNRNEVGSIAPSGVSMATLFQHAPSKDELADYWYLSEELNPELIATANVHTFKVRSPDHPCLIEVHTTTEPIKAHNAVMRTYGLGYWSLYNKKPRLFYRDGKPIPRELYHCPRIVRCILKSDRNDKIMDIIFTHKDLMECYMTLRLGNTYTCNAEQGRITFTPAYLKDLLRAIDISDKGDHFRIDMEMPIELIPNNKIIPSEDKAAAKKALPKSNSTPNVNFYEDLSPGVLYREAVAQIQLAEKSEIHGKKEAYAKASALFEKIIDIYGKRSGDQRSRLQAAYCRLATVQYALAMVSSKDRILLENSAGNFRAALQLSIKDSASEKLCAVGLKDCEKALGDNIPAPPPTLSMSSGVDE